MNNPVTPCKLALYATPPHECSYIPQREATTLFTDPLIPKSTALYSALAREGFRRSGEHIYRPHCRNCQACVPVRVPVSEFRPRRNQLRTWKLNQDLQVTAALPLFKEEYFQLYEGYISARHRGGGMDHPDPQHFVDFLTSSWSETVFYEFRLERRLLAIAVVDYLVDALSAVYTFFDPQYAKRSLGRLAILYEIKEAKERGLKWLYLGYWVSGCRKMQYKNEYQPLEYLSGSRWIHQPFASNRPLRQNDF